MAVNHSYPFNYYTLSNFTHSVTQKSTTAIFFCRFFHIHQLFFLCYLHFILKEPSQQICSKTILQVNGCGQKTTKCSLHWMEWWIVVVFLHFTCMVQEEYHKFICHQFNGHQRCHPWGPPRGIPAAAVKRPSVCPLHCLRQSKHLAFSFSSERAGPSHSSLLTPCSVLAEWRGRRKGKGVGTGAWVEWKGGVEGAVCGALPTLSSCCQSAHPKIPQSVFALNGQPPSV